MAAQPPRSTWDSARSANACRSRRPALSPSATPPLTKYGRHRSALPTKGAGWTAARWRSACSTQITARPSICPDLPTTASTDQPWLPYATLAVYLRPELALYAGYTRGLEESGIAPNNVLNRNEALSAIRTKQINGGLRWTLNERHKLVLGAFDVRKPYFNTDELNRFAVLGEVQHRGIEFSVTSAPTERLNVLFGAVLMKPRVTGQAVADGRVGERPLGQAETIVRLNADYRPAFLEGLSFDAALSGFDERPASRDNRVMLPSYATVDLGARYRFTLGENPTTLRVQLGNVTDEFVWSVSGSNSYGLTDRRRLTVLLTMDI